MGHFVGWTLAVPTYSSGSARTSTWQLPSSRAKGGCRMDPSLWSALLRPNGCQQRGSFHVLNVTDSHQQQAVPFSLTSGSQGVRYCQLSQWQKALPGTALSWQSAYRPRAASNRRWFLEVTAIQATMNEVLHLNKKASLADRDGGPEGGSNTRLH